MSKKRSLYFLVRKNDLTEIRKEANIHLVFYYSKIGVINILLFKWVKWQFFSSISQTSDNNIHFYSVCLGLTIFEFESIFSTSQETSLVQNFSLSLPIFPLQHRTWNMLYYFNFFQEFITSLDRYIDFHDRLNVCQEYLLKQEKKVNLLAVNNQLVVI